MPLSSDLRAYIKELKPICEYCKKTPTEEIHHSDGNPKNNSVSNLMSVCIKCHRRRGYKRERPSSIIHRLFKKCARLHQKNKSHDFVEKLKKYLKKHCPVECVCLKRK